MSDTLTHQEFTRILEEARPRFVDHSGKGTDQSYVLSELKEGWHVGVVILPISNAITAFWVVATSHHKNHRGFDAGECLEAVATYMDSDLEEFIEDWQNSGGSVYEVD